MDLSMILNNDGDDGGYASSTAPSPRVAHVPASSRWSVDEMRSAVAILSDIQGPEEEEAPLHHVHSEGRSHTARAAETRYPVDEDETEDEEDLRIRRRQAPLRPPRTPSPPPRHAAPPSSGGFSGLDLLFQADAMIQKRTSPERSASRAEKSTKKAKKTTSKPTKKKPIADDDDVEMENDDDDDDVEGTPKAAPVYLRSGFWTRAEEEYAAALIFYFLRGALPIAEGMTLRKYLAEKLCCNRRRVSMKLATETIADKKIPRKVGASVFVALKPAPSDADREQVRDTLDRLRRDCFREVEGANVDNNNDGDVADTDDVRTPRQTGSGSSKRGPVSPLMLGASQSSPSDKLQSTPARRKSNSKPTPSPKKRRPSVSSNPKSSPPNIRRRRPMIIRTGFDTPEEEEFVTALVEYFTDGLLELNDNTRLVTYLCEQLDCSPKTLSMKLAPRKMGEHKFPENIGTIMYARKDDDDASSEIFEAEAHVFELRQNWLQARDRAQEQAEGVAGDDDEAEEKASIASSPLSTPSRKVKSEPSAATSTPGTKNPSNASRPYSRSGPWSRHEEEYAAGLIDCFFRGVLDITEGTTLRAFLTSRLNCNPMRISKKLASHTIADVKIPKKLGSATYVRRDGVSDAERRSAEEHLRHLEHLSMSEQHLKEDIVIGVIGNKHTREEETQPVPEATYDHHYGHYHHEQQHYPTGPQQHEDHHRRHHYGDAPSPVHASARSLGSPFKMRRVVVDDYSHVPHEQVPGHHHAHRSSPPGTYDHHDASMRYQRVAY